MMSQHLHWTVNTLERLRGERLKGIDVDAVLVDCSFMLSESKKEEIYNAFLFERVKDKPFFFIFVEW